LLDKDPTTRIPLAEAKRHIWVWPAVPGSSDAEKTAWLDDSDPDAYSRRQMAQETNADALYSGDGRIVVTEEEITKAVTMGVVKRFFKNMSRRVSALWSSSQNLLAGAEPGSPTEEVPKSPSRDRKSSFGNLFWKRPSQLSLSVDESTEAQDGSSLRQHTRTGSVDTDMSVTTTIPNLPEPESPTSHRRTRSTPASGSTNSLLKKLNRKSVHEPAAPLALHGSGDIRSTLKANLHEPTQRSPLAAIQVVPSSDSVDRLQSASSIQLEASNVVLAPRVVTGLRESLTADAHTNGNNE
jgi:hypothetical protein